MNSKSQNPKGNESVRFKTEEQAHQKLKRLYDEIYERIDHLTKEGTQ